MLNDGVSVRRDLKENSPCLNGHGVQPSGQIRVLISHSDPLIAAGLEAVLRKHPELKIVISRPESEVACADVDSAEADIVIADYGSGLRLSAAGRESSGQVVILTHSDSESQICRALERGVRGYLLLGCSPGQLVEGIRSVYEGGVALGPLVACRLAESMKQQPLTAREEGVLRQLMLGLSNKGIADKFALAEGTVKAHVKSIFAKLSATSRTEAIAIAHRRGLLACESEASTLQPIVSERIGGRRPIEGNGGEP